MPLDPIYEFGARLMYQAWLHDVLLAWANDQVKINNHIQVWGGWYKPYHITIGEVKC